MAGFEFAVEYNDHQPAEKRARSNNSSSRSTPHRCQVCQRTYERADHLSRHLKSHENSRSFRCQQCPKSFNRVDLLSRHVQSHERNALHGRGRPQIRRTDRAGQACLACAAAKVKCEDRKPCGRCQSKNITCETSSVVSHQPHISIQDSLGSPPARQSVDGNIRSIPVSQIVTDHDAFDGPGDEAADGIAISADMYLETVTPRSYAGAVNLPPPQPADPTGVPDAAFGMPSFQLDSSQFDFDAAANGMLFIPNPADFNNQIFDFDFHDFDFSMAEVQDMERRSSVNKGSGSIEAASRRHAAFVRSPWLWTPAPQDHILSDQDHLTLDVEDIPSPLTNRSPGLLPNIPSCGIPVIDTGLRDKMFYLISSMHKYTNRAPSFPSLNILNHIIEAFFIRHSYQIDHWIHVPTISLKDVHPEFIIALVTAGTTVIAVPEIWKLGLVLQDVIRVTVGELWERENSNTRRLQPLQAWMLFLDSGLWSGFRRQMELAESFGQPMITMMRRGGILSAELDTHALVPKNSDINQTLEMKWRKWAQRESFKRLSLHLFLHDTRASVVLQKGPLLSFSELTFSAPMSRQLFLAGSAEEWKTKYLDLLPLSDHQYPRLIDTLHNLSILDRYGSNIDVNLCYTALLHGYWSQIWAFRESCKFHDIGDNRDSVHRLWLTTQQRELYREVEIFKERLLNLSVQQPQLLMTADLFLMILNVSLEDLQRFAGKSGEEAAAQTLLPLQRWSATIDARRAVWHAAQIFRRAKLLPPAELRDFHAVTVYFASLAMWVYGHLSGPGPYGEPGPSTIRQSITSSESQQFVLLDVAECSRTRSFIAEGSILPALSPIDQVTTPGNVLLTTEPFIPLSDANEVLKMARDLYRGNFPALDEPLPPLVKNMGNLMRDLSNIPESRFSRATSPVER